MHNFLKNETSPYLLQHAENPVNWYPWCKEAFEQARKEDKPIFLSIGYSTCHWCHVMAHESFEDEKTAEILNQYFISIKVDKEERPDKVTIVVKEKEELEKLRCRIPLDTAICVLEKPTKDYPLSNDTTTFYVCKGHSCLPPVNELKL